MPKSSIAHFKPNFKQLGFRSPRWIITNYFAKIHTQIVKQNSNNKLK